MTSANLSLIDEFRTPTALSPSLLQSLLHRLFSHPKIYNGFIEILKLPSVQNTLSGMDDKARSTLVRTVELFAFGTIGEYYELKERGEVWTLNEAQLDKLRMLTVVSLARGQVDDYYSNLSTSLSGDVQEMAVDDEAGAAATKQNRKRGKKKSKSKDDGGMLSIPYSRLASELRIPDANNDGDGTSTTMYDENVHMRQLEDLLIQCIYSNVISAKLDQSSKSLRIEPAITLVQDPAGGGGSTGSSKSISPALL